MYARPIIEYCAFRKNVLLTAKKEPTRLRTEKNREAIVRHWRVKQRRVPPRSRTKPSKVSLSNITVLLTRLFCHYFYRFE